MWTGGGLEIHFMPFPVHLIAYLKVSGVTANKMSDPPPFLFSMLYRQNRRNLVMMVSAIG